MRGRSLPCAPAGRHAHAAVCAGPLQSPPLPRIRGPTPAQVRAPAAPAPPRRGRGSAAAARRGAGATTGSAVAPILGSSRRPRPSAALSAIRAHRECALWRETGVGGRALGPAAPRRRPMRTFPIPPPPQRLRTRLHHDPRLCAGHAGHAGDDARWVGGGRGERWSRGGGRREAGDQAPTVPPPPSSDAHRARAVHPQPETRTRRRRRPRGGGGARPRRRRRRRRWRQPRRRWRRRRRPGRRRGQPRRRRRWWRPGPGARGGAGAAVGTRGARHAARLPTIGSPRPRAALPSVEAAPAAAASRRRAPRRAAAAAARTAAAGGKAKAAAAAAAPRSTGAKAAASRCARARIGSREREGE